eukprot:Opistho-2@68062
MHCPGVYGQRQCVRPPPQTRNPGIPVHPEEARHCGRLYPGPRLPPPAPAVVLHRDMKSPNVLIDAHYVAKVADFGLSTFKKPEEGVVVGSLLWMAPEVMAGQYTTASDVYSFGVILWELIAEELPFSEYHTGNAEEFHNVIMPRVGTKGLRPTISADFPPQIAELVRSCWAQDATQRPSAKVVNDRLRALSH